MRSVIGLAAAIAAAFPAVAMGANFGIGGTASDPHKYNAVPPPPPPQCPAMFNTKINLTTPTYGPMTNSIHYVLTTQRINYGRPSWLQLRFVSNVQKPLRNVRFCQLLTSWSPSSGATAKPAPEFQNRIKFSPRVRRSNPQPYPVVITNGTNNYGYYDPAITPSPATAYCVKVPRIKPGGTQKVNFRWYTDRCLVDVTFNGWVEMDNPNGSNPAGTPPDQCLAGTEPSNPNRVYTVRNFKSVNRKISRRCDSYPY